MSVFTTVTAQQLSAWLAGYPVGDLIEHKGIAAGIENTNYFVTTTRGSYVLTLFEKLQAHELPYYLNLMAHLARHAIQCPQPVANLRNEYVGELGGKPASLVSRLPGSDIAAITPAHCALIGELLARLHVAGAGYPATMSNPRGPRWWTAAAPAVRPFLDAPARALLAEEVRFQAVYRWASLKRGVIHGDLFLDNVLWDGAHVGGVIDFYFACNDVLLYDVAITVNDWCWSAAEATLDPERTTALLEAYHANRAFSDEERAAWPVLLRAAALRFWVSRLYDLHLPRAGELTHAKDPRHFQQMLEHHVARASGLAELFVT